MELQHIKNAGSFEEHLFPESRDERFMRETKELYATFKENPTNEVRNELTRRLHNATETQKRQMGFDYKDLREQTEQLNKEMKIKKKKQKNLETHRTHYGARCAR